MDQVDISRIRKVLRKVPKFVLSSIRQWVLAVETFGLREVRKVKGYHDEPLKGPRAGQRSVRLNRQWRLIYSEKPDGAINVVTIEEVTPHDYRTR